MPRKAAASLEESGPSPPETRRRSSRIKEQPKPEPPVRKAPAKPRIKKADKPKAADDEDPKEKPASSRGRKRKEPDSAEANGAVPGAEDEPAAKKAKPASKTATKPASKAAEESGKPSSKASAKPASKASTKPASKAEGKPTSRASGKPSSRAGSRKPASKVVGEAPAVVSAAIAATINEEPEAEAQASGNESQPEGPKA